MNTGKIRANFGAIDTAGADIGTAEGHVEALKADARAEFNRIIGNLGDGMGPETVAAVRQKFEDYLESHLNAMKSTRSHLHKAGDTMLHGGQRMVSHLGNRS